jgi:hypothetical protein
MYTHTYIRKYVKKKKTKQSPYKPGQAVRVPAGWGSQISRQSAHEGGNIVSLRTSCIFEGKGGSKSKTGSVTVLVCYAIFFDTESRLYFTSRGTPTWREKSHSWCTRTALNKESPSKLWRPLKSPFLRNENFILYLNIQQLSQCRLRMSLLLTHFLPAWPTYGKQSDIH